MMSYGGVRSGMGDLRGGCIGGLVEDASAAAEAAADGKPVVLPAGVRLARVTTQDPPPAGDLAIRTSPSVSSPQIPGGGASKDGIVAVILAGEAGDFSEVVWPGDARRQGGHGFAHSSALVLLSDDGSPAGMSTGAKVAIGAALVLVAGGVAVAALR